MSAPETEYYRLRTEWLRFKSHLFDSLTGLPTLPAIVEDIRRVAESRGWADVVYLDLGRSGWHETRLGWAAYDEAVRDFAKLLGSMRDSGELGAHDLVCLQTVRSDRFLVFLAGSEEGWEGRPSLRRERLLKSIHAGLAAAQRRSLLGSVRLASGHARLRPDPMIRVERSIQQAVADAMLMSLVEREGLEASRREELRRIIAQGAIRTVFHPIVRLADGEVIGYEALTRPIDATFFDSVEELFAFAESTDLLLEFERLCRATAIRATAGLADRGLLFLNSSPRAIEDPEWSNGVMDLLLSEAGIAPHEVVVEITERMAIVGHEAFQAVLRTFKERGYRVAVDDMGAGYSSLQALASIEPDFLKFDVSLVREIDRSSIKRSLLESLRALAEKIRARVIAEGVERAEERATLLSLGIELGQGFHFHQEGVEP